MKKAEDDFLQSTTEIHNAINKGNAQQHKSDFLGQDLLLPKICAGEQIPANTGPNCASKQSCSAASPTKTVEKATADPSGIFFFFHTFAVFCGSGL